MKRKSAKRRTTTAVKSRARTPVVRRRKRTAPAPRKLVEAPPEKCFWVNFGPVLRNLRELHDALDGHLSKAQFAHHVGPGRNDFASWVEAVLDDAACARALRSAKTRRGMLGAVRVRLSLYA